MCLHSFHLTINQVGVLEKDPLVSNLHLQNEALVILRHPPNATSAFISSVHQHIKTT